VNALAARVDAFLADSDDADEKPAEPPKRLVSEPSIDVPIEIDADVEEVVDSAPVPVAAAPAPDPRMTQAYRAIPPPAAGLRPAVPPPTPRGVPPIPGPPKIPSIGAKPPAIPIPVPRATQPSMAVPPPPPPGGHEAKTKTGELPPLVGRTKTSDHAAPPPPRTRTSDELPTGPSSQPPPPPGSDLPARSRRVSTPPATAEEMLAGVAPDITKMDFGVEVGTGTANIVHDKPLEAMLEHPTVVDKALAALGDAGGEQRAEVMTKELESKVMTDPAGAAFLAYELGELYERRLADEARAVKAYGRAVNLDPSLRANLWAIRRVFYRRALWPNLAKLVDAEVAYARDDYERADLLLEKARVHAHRMNELDEARTALDEAARIAPQHQGVLLELERIVAKQNDAGALRDVWERLAESVEQPARKLAYWLEVARSAAGANEDARANEAFDKAAAIAAGTPHAERVARERLRVAEDGGSPEEVGKAIGALADVLLAVFGPAGPTLTEGAPAGERPDRATALRHELVALRRRQAQLARASDQSERAWELLQQASALAPGEAIVLADLTELAEELGRYDDLAELVQSWQAVEADPSQAMALSIRRADALLRGGQRDQARALLASLEAAAPGFVILSSIAERDALGRNDAGELAKVYITAAQAAHLGTHLGPGQNAQPEPKAAAALYVQAAELLAYDVTTPEAIEEARTILGKALEAVPDDPAAAEALVELDDSTGNLEPALARLHAAVDKATDKRSLLERAIRLARAHGALEKMVELERELVALAPEDLKVRWRLESTLAQLGRDDERADLLVHIAADETDATGRGTALSAAARLRERAGNVEAATDLYRQVLALWPEDTFARDSLVDLLRAQERWPELVSERRAEARALPDGPAARRALREAAWVLEVRQGDAAQAAQVYDDWLVRFPDDRAALEGVARCRAAFGDRNGVVTARAAIAEHDPHPDAQWLHSVALERAGQFDEAAEVWRELRARPEESVASTAATLALGELAATRGDTVMRVEAAASLAARAADARLGSALAEDSGWMYALVLDDFERAAQSFQAATELDPSRRGALLGAALVASRVGDRQALAHAYEQLAAQVQMPDAAAALYLRSAALGAAAGELEVANARIAAAAAAAPDDTSALLVVAETSISPIVADSDPFAAVDPLLARAEVLEMRGALADDPIASASWELDRAEALELAGRLKEAGSVVASVLKARPDDLRALTAIRRMAKRAGDVASTAQAAYGLARVLGDRDAKLELLREAAAVFDGPGLPHNTDYAVASYKRIVQLDPGSHEIERLMELLRERADVRSLVAVLTDRLTWLEAEGRGGEEAVPHLLERATVLHGLGDEQAAMADLDSLLEQSPNNVEALRFRGDLAINAGDVDTAIVMWRRYLGNETRPARRGDIELQLAQVLAENTGDLAGAIEQLERVVEANSDDVPLRERLLGLCLRASDWDRAVRELRALARARPTPQDKAREELRLGLMLRDRLNDRVGARLALDRARTLDPVNLDVVRELADILDPHARGQMLAATAHSFREQAMQTPRVGALYERLAQIHSWQADVDARWVTLGAVEALATPTIDQRQVLAQGRQTIAARGPKRVKLDESDRARLRGGHGGAFAELWRAIAPAVQVATGVDPGKLGFTRGDKLALKKLGAYEPLSTALACFGIEEIELYISANRAGFARSLAGETPILVMGADVAAAQNPHHRFLLGRSAAKIAEGIATLPDLREGELAWTLVAALRASEVQVPPTLAQNHGGDDNAIAERTKILKKELSRKAKQVVQQLAPKLGDLSDPEVQRRAAVGVGSRAGLVWSGDIGVALQVLDVGKGGRSLADSPAALELVAWSVSEAHLTLREKLGISLVAQR
jgi:tetratricopeptide (TPR) repeat protein